MYQNKNPKWWNDEHESRWNRVKAAFQRDWDQTKHDFGANKPDTDQDVDDTVKQAAGKQSIPPRGKPAYKDLEPAYRFGYGARRQYGPQYSAWDEKLESQLKQDWQTTYPDQQTDWEDDRHAIRTGWDYRDDQGEQQNVRKTA